MVQAVSERFRSIVRITAICADICGCNVLDPNFRINIRTILVLVVINLSLFFLSYTMYDGFVIKGDWKIILQVLSIGGGTLIQVRKCFHGPIWNFCSMSFLQGFCKLTNCIRQQKKIRFLNEELHAIYDEYELKGSEYRIHLNKGCQLLSLIMKLSAFIVILMVIGMALVTLIWWQIFGIRVLIVHCRIPGVDDTTVNGFILTSSMHITFVSIGGFGFYAGDMGFFTPISQVITFSGIIKCKFHDLNTAMSGDHGNKHMALKMLRDILVFHQKYLR